MDSIRKNRIFKRLNKKRMERTADDINQNDEENLQDVQENKEINNSDKILSIKNNLRDVYDNANNVKESYKKLLESLNGLNSLDQNTYNELKLMVKLPTADNVREIADLHDDIISAVDKLANGDFLKSLK